MRETLIYSQSYRKGQLSVRKDKLPTINHSVEGLQPVECHVMKTGIVERGGTRYEFQDMRMYFPCEESP